MHSESELTFLNKIFIRIYLSFIGFIAVAYSVYYAISNNPYKEVFVAALAVLFVIILVLDLRLYKKDKTSRRLYVLSGNFFMLYYTVVLLYTNNPAVFSYIIPILVLIMMYDDTKYSKKLGIAAIIINIIDMVSEFVIKKTSGQTPVDSFIIQLIVTCITVLILSQAGKALAHIAQDRIRIIAEGSEQLRKSVHEIDEQLNMLNSSSTNMKQTMENVDTGIGETAHAVQNQLQQTGEIQGHIEAIQTAADQILGNMQSTAAEVEQGTEEITGLLAGADNSVNAGNLVIQKLDELKSNMDEVNHITDLIDDIAFQSYLMALNARVEASRAGEAGKGFAVVATEISSMSDKTKEATATINTKLEYATSSLNELVAVINNMLKGINEEKQRTDATAGIFGSIRANTDDVRERVEALLEDIRTLNTANSQIVSSIETISATSEEVTALAGTALRIERSNADSISHIAETVAGIS